MKSKFLTFILISFFSSSLVKGQSTSTSSQTGSGYDWTIQSGAYYSSPSKIVVDGASGYGGSILLQSDGGMNGPGAITMNANGGGNILFNTNGTTKMTLLNNGNLGLGTTSPSAKLDINGSLNVNGTISFGASTVSSSSSISRTGGMNGDIVNINVNGRGGLKNYAIFGYDAGIVFYYPTSINSNLSVQGNSYISGNMGIGCSSSTAKLAVNGKIQATEIEIKSTPCSDFVFEGDYKLMNLSDLENFVKTNKHLPEIPSAKQFQENGGYNLTQMDDLLLRKVEELTLYIIELKKENEELRTLINNK